MEPLNPDHISDSLPAAEAETQSNPLSPTVQEWLTRIHQAEADAQQARETISPSLGGPVIARRIHLEL